jgi:hypothetical protein
MLTNDFRTKEMASQAIRRVRTNDRVAERSAMLIDFVKDDAFITKSIAFRLALTPDENM